MERHSTRSDHRLHLQTERHEFCVDVCAHLIVCKELRTEAPMPTNQCYWEGYNDVSDSRLIADLPYSHLLTRIARIKRLMSRTETTSPGDRRVSAVTA